MKKVLSMALALMMVFSLFAVPAMAATMTVENIPLGDMTSFIDGTDLTGANTANQFGGSSATANNALSKIVVQDGNNVMQIASTGANAELRSATFTPVIGKEYVASADVYISKKYTTNSENVDTGYLQFQFASATSSGNATWGQGTATAEGMEAITASSTSATLTFSSLPLNTWLHITAPVTLNKEGITTTSFNVIIKTEAADESAVFGYIDNVSVTHEEAAVAVTKSVTGNGTMTGVEDVVGVGETKTLTLTPTSTSYLKALTVNGTDVTASATKTWNTTLNNYVSTYDVTLNADTAITAEFADYTMVTKVDEDMEDYAVADGFAATNWGKSSTGAVELTTDPVYGNVLKVTAGEARTPGHTVELGIYKVSFDAKADTAGTIKLQNSAAYSASVSKWQGTAQGAYRPAVTTNWEHYEFYFEPTGYSTGDETSSRSLAMGIEGTTAGLYLDNVNIVYYSTAAAPALEVYDVVGTTNNEAYGTVTPATTTATEGEDVTFTVTPKLGYYVAAATLNGENVLASFDAYTGGTYTVEDIAADTTLAVEFAAVTGKGESVATLPAVFAPAADTAVTFGKVLDTTEATSWGIELTKDGVGVTPYHGGSYLYKANATNANGQYAIEFVGLEAGTYQIRSYVYVNGEATFGAPSTFVVD